MVHVPPERRPPRFSKEVVRMTRHLPTRLAELLIALSLVCLPTPTPAQTVDGTWSMISTGPGPSPRREYASIYDAPHHRYLVFAGSWVDFNGGYQLFNEVWVLTLGPTPAWSLLTTAGSP